MKRYILSLIILISVTNAVFANNTDEFTLKNGLSVIVREDHRAPVVFASIWYKVGGSYEHDGITGISHMLEHMMFRGTKKYGPGKLIQIVSDNGGQQNAMTGQDYTAYYQAWSKDKLPLSFKLEADRMRGLALQQKLYDKEHQVVMEERRLRVDDNPQGKTIERFNAAAFINNPYHHPVVGWMTDIKHLTLTDLKNWYHTWYAPNNAVVVVVGDVKPKAVKALAKKYFAKIKDSKLPAVKPRSEVASTGLRRVVVHARAKVPWLVMGYNTPSVPTLLQENKKNVWQAYALEMAAGVLDAGSSSRLSRDLVRGKQLLVSASAGYSPYTLYSDTFTLTAVPVPGHNLREAQKALLAEIKRLKTTLVSAAELQRIQAQVIAQNIYDKDSLTNQAMEIGALTAVGLPWQEGDRFVQHIKAVTPLQIQQVAKQYFRKNRLTIAVLIPKKQKRGAQS
ncbi:MAG: insulinase family protein [Gammaproteobacteria bacterium]|nr:insulinase family protein [Gammaproteobacteria bacterium]MCH9743320.1 insulinase family protein [Gammaproteobacteria bacterium]